MSLVPRLRAIMAGLILTALGLTWLARAVPAAGFSIGKTSFSIRVKGHVIPYDVFALFVMPSEVLTIEGHPAAAHELSMTANGQPGVRSGTARWRWQAPATAGLNVVRIMDVTSDEAITLNIFVTVPATQVEDGYLNGYRIGQYPDKPFRNLPAYVPPKGFVEVTEANQDTRVSPHFTLKQFLCKQAGGSTKYLALRERLLLKLETLLELVNQAGYPANTFAVLSGFRTPFYNRAIGNVPNSRHLWGGAADIFIDEAPRDGVMDDLNSDGRVDTRDAEILYQILEKSSASRPLRDLIGGMGLYGTTGTHGPFLHIDARGYRARWGR